VRLDSAHLDQARQVADAILYEGYLLYPYHKAARKNQVRFQFGVLMPPGYREVDDSERSASQTECLLECADDAEIRVLVRFLHLQRRTVQGRSPDDGEMYTVGTLYLDGTEYTGWDEATQREQWVTAGVAGLLAGDRNVQFHVGSGETTEDLADAGGSTVGRLVRRWQPLDGMIRLHAARVGGPYGALRLRLRVENHSVPGDRMTGRTDGLRHALIAAHALIAVPGGRFLSMTDPPEWAAPLVAECVNEGTWPVLAGPEDCGDLLLSSPVILYDHPQIAAQSAGDLFDATEIDEILTLRTLALTDAEKRQARATDPLAAELMDRVDGMPPEMLERMHGAIRYLNEPPAPRPVPQEPGLTAADTEPGPPGTARPPVPWWDPGADTSVSPETDQVVIGGVPVARGSQVLMRPGGRAASGGRRADAQDLFLAGRTAVVEAVLHDVDGQVHLAVTVTDDPAADLQRSHGRFLYFAPDEVEPLGPAADP
jgi:hypothetical protein